MKWNSILLLVASGNHMFYTKRKKWSPHPRRVIVKVVPISLGEHTLTQDWDLEVTDRLTIAPISWNISLYRTIFCQRFFFSKAKMD